MRRVGGQRRNGNGGMPKLVEQRPKRVRTLLRNGCGEAQRVVVKQAVTVSKRMANWRQEERLGNEFKRNKKVVLERGKAVRKGEQAKDMNGQILSNGVEVRRRWAENSEQVLSVADVMEANINVVGNCRMRCWEV